MEIFETLGELFNPDIELKPVEQVVNPEWGLKIWYCMRCDAPCAGDNVILLCKDCISHAAEMEEKEYSYINPNAL